MAEDTSESSHYLRISAALLKKHIEAGAFSEKSYGYQDSPKASLLPLTYEDIVRLSVDEANTIDWRVTSSELTAYNPALETTLADLKDSKTFLDAETLQLLIKRIKGD